MQRFQLLSECFLRIVNKFNELGRRPTAYDGHTPLTAREIHLVELIGKYPGSNVTKLAERQGVTKGAVSQTLSRLAGKNVVRKEHSPGNTRDVVPTLTPCGEQVFQAHEDFHRDADGWVWREFESMTDKEFALVERVFRMLEKSMDRYGEHLDKPNAGWTGRSSPINKEHC